MNWTEQQLAIYEWFRSGTGNLVIQARAGCGKTSSMIEAIKHAPEDKILLVAFNKRIAEELQRRIADAPVATAMTLHSYGLRTLTRHAGRVKIDEWDRRESLLDASGADELSKSSASICYRLCTLGRISAPFAKGPQDLIALQADHDLVSDDEEEIKPSDEEIRVYAYKMMVAARRSYRTIDFADMIYLPVVNNWHGERFSLVIVDECLPYKVPVLLADGTSKAIGEIVDGRESVTVLSYDEKAGVQVARRVIGWHRIPNRKQLVKVSCSRPLPGNYGRNFVVCTSDHKIYTRRGWIEAGQLLIDDQVQIETSAEKSQAYKITSRGRSVLSRLRATDGSVRGKGRNSFVAQRGGNGRGPTDPEQALAEALGCGWILNFVIAVGEGRNTGGRPTHYKIDIANPSLKLAVEVDGFSHSTLERKKQDASKQIWLEQNGWKVHRFTNRQAWQDPDGCAQSVLEHRNCPKPSWVVAVEPVDIPDYWVYDLTVEETSCFYANGVLVHNCQDLNASQLHLAKMARAEGGRTVVVGDSFQVIYGFAGAEVDGMALMTESLQAETLGLTVTHRCPKKVVDLANRWVPDLIWSPSNGIGSVSYEQSSERLSILKACSAGPAEENVVLSRTNAPLFSLGLAALRAGIPAKIIGRDVFDVVRNLIMKLSKAKKNNRSMDAFTTRVAKWKETETKRANKLSNEDLAARKVGEIADKVECILALCEGAVTVKDVLERLEAIFSMTNEGQFITLSTVHKFKGLEKERVHIMAQTFWPSEDQEEKNICYVAVTRSRRDLSIWDNIKKVF